MKCPPWVMYSSTWCYVFSPAVGAVSEGRQAFRRKPLAGGSISLAVNSEGL